MTLLLNIFIDGVTYGMVLFVMAVGLSLTLGLMRFVNLSHGAFAMAGGYGVAVLTGTHGWHFWPALATALVATGLAGALLEAFVLRHLYRRPELHQVLFTIGLTFFLVAAANALFGPQVRNIPLPESLSGAVDLGFRTLPAQRLFVLGSGIAVAAFLTWVVARTRFGIWLAGLGGVLGAE